MDNSAKFKKIQDWLVAWVYYVDEDAIYDDADMIYELIDEKYKKIDQEFVYRGTYGSGETSMPWVSYSLDEEVAKKFANNNRDEKGVIVKVKPTKLINVYKLLKDYKPKFETFINDLKEQEILVRKYSSAEYNEVD